MINAIDRFFQTTTWRVVAFISLSALLILAIRAVFFLENSFNLVQVIAKHRGVDAQELNQAVFEGKLAICALLLVSLAGFIDLVSYIKRSKEYRSVTKIIMRFQAGELSLRAPTYQNREVNNLGKAFNSMAESIVANIDRLKETDLLRRELVANVAHDLGGPITSIQGFIETIMLKEKDLKPEETKRILSIVQDNTASISAMVNELLELSVLDAISDLASFQSFSIATLANDVASRFAPRAKEKEIIINILTPHDLPLVWGDVSLIERVLSNIIENSLKYTPPKGEIRIRFAKTESEVTICIRDTGIGIPADDIPRVFERFFRVGKDRSRRSGGSGLGLAIVKKILELHGTQPKLESTLNNGTEIKFSLKLAILD